MLKLNELKRIGYDSISLKGHILKNDLNFITEDIVTHIEEMEYDEQFITEFWIDIYVTNLFNEEKMKAGFIRGSFFTPLDFTRFDINFDDVADVKGWDFYDMAGAITGKDRNIKEEIAYESDTIIHIDEFYINEQFRNYGIGSYIINNLEEILYYYSGQFPTRIIVLPQPRVFKDGEYQNISDKDTSKELLMEKLISFYKMNGFDFIENTNYMLKKIV